MTTDIPPDVEAYARRLVTTQDQETVIYELARLQWKIVQAQRLVVRVRDNPLYAELFRGLTR